jgi:tetratricopeptide (TPR) repeat protein
MKSFRPAYQPDIYDRFKEIPNRSYHQLIYFVETNQEALDGLPINKRAELQIDFSYALFETGKHEKFLLYVDRGLEMVITHNIYYHKNEDVFQELLFKKAASLYNTGELEESISILKQILRIDPSHKYTFRFLIKCIKQNKRAERLKLRAIFIGFIFLAVCFSSIEILYIQPFYDVLAGSLGFLRNGFLITALIGLLMLEGVNFIEAYMFKMRASKNKAKK